MRLINYVLSFCAMLFLLSGCSNDAKAGDSENISGGELRVALSSEPPTLDTHVTTTLSSAVIGRNIFEALVTLDSDHNVQPMLAETYEILNDGQTINFKLRKGVKFHNGEEMKASDVVASMNRWIQRSSGGKDTFKGAIFEENDEYSVRLEMAQPTSTALLVLAYSAGEYPSIMPASVIEGKESEKVTEYIGTGPFKFEEWKQNQHVHLSKFNDYVSRVEPSDGLAGKREALVDDIYCLFVTDSSTRVAGILSGEYDVIADVPIENVDKILNNEETILYNSPWELLNIFFNKKEGLFSNKIAREAVAVGVSKSDILQAAFVNPEYYNKTHHMMLASQESQWYSDIGKDEYDFVDKELSKKLFREAGYNGEEIVIMTSRVYDHMYNAAIVLQEQLNNLGIRTKLEVYDWPTFTERRSDPSTYDLTIMASTPKPEPTSLALMRKDFAGFTDSEELDKIAAKLRQAPSIEEAQKVYDELQAWFMDYRPVVKIGDADMLYAARKSVSTLIDVDGIVLTNVSNFK
jgi:peptide/nickel transport system substrate-binding protein